MTTSYPELELDAIQNEDGSFDWVAWTDDEEPADEASG